MIKKLFPLVLWFAVTSYAEPAIEFSGFGTLGAAFTDSEYYGFRSSMAQSDGGFEEEVDFGSTSSFGAQIDASLLERVDLTYQAVYRDQNNFSLNSATALAFLRFDPTPQWSFRIGRTALDLFQLSEFRDIGFSYEWAVTPPEVYGIIPFRYLDGADVTYRLPLSAATFRAKGFAGRTRSDLGTYDQYDQLELRDVIGLSLALEDLDWVLEARYATIRTGNTINGQELLIESIKATSALPNVWPDAEAFADQLNYKNSKVRYASLSGSYLFGDWQIFSEVSRISSDSLILRNLRAGYMSLIRRFGQHSFNATLSMADSPGFDMDSLGIDTSLLPPSLQESVQLAVNTADLSLHFYAPKQKTYSLGWRWNIREDLAFKLQYNRTFVEAKGGNLWLRNITDIRSASEVFPKEAINTVLANVSFIF